MAPRRRAERRLLTVGPDTVGAWMTAALGADAGAEALFRALVGEHDGDRTAAQFWIEVYGAVIAAEAVAGGRH